MLINQDFSVDRTKYIGGSDIGAILGLSKFRTPLEVWMEKTGKALSKYDSLPLRFGSFAESFVASEYARSTGFELVHDQSHFIHPQHPFMCAHLDRLVFTHGLDQPPSKILECKTANAFSRSEWGEKGTDEVPMTYLAQCAWYQAITSINATDLAVLFGNSELRIYQITRDHALEELLIQKATHFWQEHVLTDLPPPPCNEGDLQILFSKGQAQKQVEASQEIAELALRIKALNHEIEEREAQLSKHKQTIMQQMGDAEVLIYQAQILATWKAPKQSYRVDTKRLEQAHPEIASSFQIPIQNSRRFVMKDIEGLVA